MRWTKSSLDRLSYGAYLGISMGSQPLYTQSSPNRMKLSGFVDHIEVLKYSQSLLEISVRSLYTAIIIFRGIFRQNEKNLFFSKILSWWNLFKSDSKVPTIICILKGRELSYILIKKYRGFVRVSTIFSLHVSSASTIF